MAIGHIGNKIGGGNGKNLKQDQVKIPYELQFESPFKDALNDPDIADDIWYRQIQQKIYKDDVILKVYALTAPPSLGPEESRRVHIADIKLLSDLYTSKWGDSELFFKHKRVLEDRRYFPKEWARQAKRDEQCFSKVKNFKDQIQGTWPSVRNDSKEKFEA